MTDDEAEEEISDRLGELAVYNFDLLPTFLSVYDEALSSPFLALVLALAFSIAALPSSGKGKSAMFRYPGQARSAFIRCPHEGTP